MRQFMGIHGSRKLILDAVTASPSHKAAITSVPSIREMLRCRDAIKIKKLAVRGF